MNLCNSKRKSAQLNYHRISTQLKHIEVSQFGMQLLQLTTKHSYRHHLLTY